MPAERADRLLEASGLVADLREARARIMAGVVMATDREGRERKVEKAGERIDPASSFRLAGARHPYVSRGGLKLAHGLDAFGIDPSGLACLDLGVSTGGFTDCLLQRGAARVVAADVSYGLTAWRIRTDPRVVLFERTHARSLDLATIGGPAALLVADLSFIRLAPLLPGFDALLAPGGRAVLLVKPQFELDPAEIEPGGVVTDPAARRLALERVATAAEALGWRSLGALESPIAGADGNLEWLAGFSCRS